MFMPFVLRVVFRLILSHILKHLPKILKHIRKYFLRRPMFLSYANNFHFFSKAQDLSFSRYMENDSIVFVTPYQRWKSNSWRRSTFSHTYHSHAFILSIRIPRDSTSTNEIFELLGGYGFNSIRFCRRTDLVFVMSSQETRPHSVARTHWIFEPIQCCRIIKMTGKSVSPNVDEWLLL